MFDHELLTEAQNATAEPTNGGTSWASGLWTVQEVIDYANHRQHRFLKDSGILLGLADISTVPLTIQHPLPADCVEIHRVVWHSADDVFTPLFRGDAWEADNADPSWPYTTVTIPIVWLDMESPFGYFRTMPPVNDVGRLEIGYVALAETLSNAGAVDVQVPDEFAPAVKYGILADMFSKVGRANDPARAQYCEQRFELGILTAQMLIREYPQ